MKIHFKLVLLATLFTSVCFGQSIDVAKGQHHSTANDYGINAGYSFTSVTFKGTDRTAINQPTFNLDATEKYRGDGFHVGLYKKLTNSLNVEVGFSSISGSKNRSEIGSNTSIKKLKGFQIPVMANFLLREEARDLNFVVSGGLQYLNAKGEEIEENNASIKQLSAYKVSTVYLSFGVGVQFRITQNLHIAYQSRISVGPNSRYSDNGVFSLKYAFGR